jgi:GyrI-like small molecule binding domain
MKAAILIISVVLANAGLAQDRSLSQFENLKEPKVSARKSEKMLVVEAKGDPNVVGPKAFGLLFQLYYSLKETPKGPMQALPRARWPESNTTKSEWIGFYGLPVPETVTRLPEHQAPAGLKVSLTTWEYGEVAEILHAGPYDKEEPTMLRLTDFTKQQGYKVLGGHEEEYIKGPTMSGPGDPEKYLTIIRYRVQKSGKND